MHLAIFIVLLLIINSGSALNNFAAKINFITEFIKFENRPTHVLAHLCWDQSKLSFSPLHLQSFEEIDCQELFSDHSLRGYARWPLPTVLGVGIVPFEK